jgi:inhibitor of KinA sporulation pathway (predicted exonuclease)
MTELNFLALDLEMNTLEGTHEPGKIIQVGIAIGNLNSYTKKESYIERSWYVDPFEPIYPRITELTGITNDNVAKESTPLETIQDEIYDLMQEHKCFANPVVWGGGDANLFKKEAKEKFGYCKLFGHREIDLKTIYSFFQMAKNEKINSSLKSTLASYKLNFEGTQHRAVDDARNTLSLFFAMILKQKAIYNLINEAKNLK